jgi:glycerol-1-phosphate dehydrogenase [NAD(P)+]
MKVDLSAFSAPCSCGRTHPISLKECRIARGALNDLPEVIDNLGKFERIGMICDDNTWAAAAHRVPGLVNLFSQAKLNPAHLHANENAVAAAKAQLNPDCDLLIAVGAGTVHDITRFIAHEWSVPFVSVPTAPSVDGFVSTIAAMTWGGCKKSFPSTPPVAVVADSDVLAVSPQRLIAAGVGDLLGKYTALLDWKVTNLLNGEYICDYVVKLEEDAVDEVRACLPEIAAGDADAIERLMYGLILSGLAMQGVGNSRPASGSEHHMSHLWEMQILNGELDAYHGERVAVGTVLLCDYYRKLLHIDDPRAHLSGYTGIDEEMLCRRFPGCSDGILEENRPDPLAAIDVNVLCDKFDEVKAMVAKLPSAEEVIDYMKTCGGVYSLAQIGVDPSLLPDTLELAPYVRARLTLLRIMKLLKV